MNSLGFRILPIRKRPDPQLIEAFKEIVTPHISDNMSRMSGGDAQLRAFHSQGKLVGTAFTVKTRPGDNLMVHKAIDIAQPGDVIVVDANGEMTNSIIGEIMVRIAEKRRLGGFVIHGAIRDAGAIGKGSFPVFARGITHRGPYKDGPGEINVPVSLGGVTVHPGDIVVGDEDGIAVVPLQYASDILTLARQHQKMEEEIFQSIDNGTIDRTWVDETLKQKGCVLDGDSDDV